MLHNIEAVLIAWVHGSEVRRGSQDPGAGRLLASWDGITRRSRRERFCFPGTRLVPAGRWFGATADRSILH